MTPVPIRTGHLTVLAILILALTAALSGPGHATAAPAPVHHSSLLLTVNPDRSVVIGWNTTTYSSRLQNISRFFPSGYAFQSSTTFSQQANAVVETTKALYQLPLGIQYLAILSPIQHINIVHSASSNRVSVNASAQVYFSSTFYHGTVFENYTSFQKYWSSTFGNQTWINTVTVQIQKATHIVQVSSFYGTLDIAPGNGSASVSIVFVGMPSGSNPNFVSAFVTFLKLPLPLQTELNGMLQSVLSLSMGNASSLTYDASTGKFNFTSTADFVSNLDARLNTLKGQFFQAVFGVDPDLANSPTLSFFNSTEINVSRVSIESELDLGDGTYSTVLSGLVIDPSVGIGSTSSNFSIPGLFTTLGQVPFSAHGVNITLAGGSDSSGQVKIVVPSGTVQPDTTTSNSATWNNANNASELQNVKFEIQALSAATAPFLTSPAGIVVEGAVIGAIGAGLAIYLRKRRSASGTTPSPDLGLGSTSPLQ